MGDNGIEDDVALLAALFTAADVTDLLWVDSADGAVTVRIEAEVVARMAVDFLLERDWAIVGGDSDE